MPSNPLFTEEFLFDLHADARAQQSICTAPDWRRALDDFAAACHHLALLARSNSIMTNTNHKEAAMSVSIRPETLEAFLRSYHQPGYNLSISATISDDGRPGLRCEARSKDGKFGETRTFIVNNNEIEYPDALLEVAG